MKTGGTICICLGILGFVVVTWLVFFQSKPDWPWAKGTVVNFYIEQQRPNKFVPRINYRFEVDGTEYSGKRISWIEHYSGNQATAQKRAPYFNGKEVKVFYNPENPKQCLLEQGISSGYIHYSWPAVFVIVGIFLTIFGFSTGSRKRL